MGHPARRATLFGAIVAVVAATAVSGAVATAAETPVQQTADPAIASLAADRGISIAAASLRMSWQDRAPALDARLRAELGDRFGGVWIDDKDGDRIKAGVVGSATSSDAVRAAATAAGVADAVDVVPVRRSLADLESAVAWLAERLAVVNTGASAPIASGIRVERNGLELRIPAAGALTAAQQRLVADATKRYGDAVLVERADGVPTADACSYPDCDPPLRGGVRITRPGSGCTSGFAALSWFNNVYYLLTAGHCTASAPSATWSTQFAGGSTHVIGNTHNHVLGGAGDMAIIRVNNPGGWDLPRGIVFVTAGPDTARDETYHISSEGGSVVGQRVCKSGAYYGRTDCGTVRALGASLSYSGVTVNHLGRADYCRTGGDSGGSVYASHVAYGMHVAGTAACTAYYQGISGAELALSVEVLNSSS